MSTTAAGLQARMKQQDLLREARRSRWASQMREIRRGRPSIVTGQRQTAR